MSLLSPLNLLLQSGGLHSSNIRLMHGHLALAGTTQVFILGIGLRYTMRFEMLLLLSTSHCYAAISYSIAKIYVQVSM
ncbi:hypothetical protein BDW75DRAFT_218629 [Aspergillus navahoensis]